MVFCVFSSTNYVCIVVVVRVSVVLGLVSKSILSIILLRLIQSRMRKIKLYKESNKSFQGKTKGKVVRKEVLLCIAALYRHRLVLMQREDHCIGNWRVIFSAYRLGFTKKEQELETINIIFNNTYCIEFMPYKIRFVVSVWKCSGETEVCESKEQ